MDWIGALLSSGVSLARREAGRLGVMIRRHVVSQEVSVQGTREYRVILLGPRYLTSCYGYGQGITDTQAISKALATEARTGPREPSREAAVYAWAAAHGCSPPSIRASKARI